MKKTVILLLVLAFLGISFCSFAGKVPTKGVVNANIGLNVRSEPTTSASVVTALNNGETVTITGVTGKWYKISCGSTVGYCYAAYITVTETADKYDEAESGGSDSGGSDSGLSPEAAALKAGRDISRSALNATLTTAP